MKTYFISYWDRFCNTKHEFIKARNEQKAQKKFYKIHDKCVIIKIALN